MIRAFIKQTSLAIVLGLLSSLALATVASAQTPAYPACPGQGPFYQLYQTNKFWLGAADKIDDLAHFGNNVVTLISSGGGYGGGTFCTFQMPVRAGVVKRHVSAVKLLQALWKWTPGQPIDNYAATYTVQWSTASPQDMAAQTGLVHLSEMLTAYNPELVLTDIDTNVADPTQWAFQQLKINNVPGLANAPLPLDDTPFHLGVGFTNSLFWQHPDSNSGYNVWLSPTAVPGLVGSFLSYVGVISNPQTNSPAYAGAIPAIAAEVTETRQAEVANAFLRNGNIVIVINGRIPANRWVVIERGWSDSCYHQVPGARIVSVSSTTERTEVELRPEPSGSGGLLRLASLD